jgi:uncharacterized delta-60 repeat protein
MNARSKCAGFLLSSILLFSLAWTASPPPLVAQDVVVSAAVPDNAPQGTVNLNVRVKGNGFKKGAIAKWLVNGSEIDTGGVTVNTTAYVSATELLANITVAPNAQTDKKFDIKVTLSSGRTGKGIELFSVRKGTTGCTAPTPILAAPWSCLLPGAAGCQDTTFGSNGLVITNTSGSTPTMTDIDIAKDVATQSDGKLVVVGGSLIEGAPPGTSRFALVRYNPDGTLDPTFGGSGIVKLQHPTSLYPWAKAVAIQPDGKIVVAGGNSLVARYNPDGTLDAGFGNGGLTLVTFPSGRKGKPGQYVNANFRDMAIQSDGKIVLVGNSDWAGWAIGRLNPNGSLDPTFGNGGRVTLESTGGWAFAVALQPVQMGTTTEDRILVGGSAVAGASQQGDEDFAVMRFTPAGIIDSTFGPTGSGSVLTQFCTEQDRVSGLALDAVGNIVAGGFAKFNGTDNFAIARYSPNGVLDTSFGDPSSGTNQEGKTIVSLMAADSTGNDLLLQPDGKVIVTGTAEEASLRYYFGLARFNADGTLDTTFGTGGVVVTDFGPGKSQGFKGAIQSDGKIVLVGTVDTNGTGYNFGVARYWY